MRWQNIFENRCPKCGGQLLSKKVSGDTWHNCDDPFCGFGINDLHLLDCIKDPKHPVHQFAPSRVINKLDELQTQS